MTRTGSGSAYPARTSKGSVCRPGGLRRRAALRPAPRSAGRAAATCPRPNAPGDEPAQPGVLRRLAVEDRVGVQPVERLPVVLRGRAAGRPGRAGGRAGRHRRPAWLVATQTPGRCARPPARRRAGWRGAGRGRRPRRDRRGRGSRRHRRQGRQLRWALSHPARTRTGFVRHMPPGQTGALLQPERTPVPMKNQQIAAALCAVSALTLTACGGSGGSGGAVTVTVTPTVTAGSPNRASTPRTAATSTAATSDVTGRGYDFGTVTRWRRWAAPRSSRSTGGPSRASTTRSSPTTACPSPRSRARPFENQNSKLTYDIPVAEDARILYHHCVAADQPQQTRSATMQELAALKAPREPRPGPSGRPGPRRRGGQPPRLRRLTLRPAAGDAADWRP